jgi:hypothetical protein
MGRKGRTPDWDRHELLALVGPDARPSCEHNAAVVELAREGSGRPPGVLVPAPSRLQDVVADHGLGKANLVGSTQLVADHRLGLVEVADFDSAWPFLRRRFCPAVIPRT